LVSAVTISEGVRSSWNGQRPTGFAPVRFSSTPKPSYAFENSV